MVIKETIQGVKRYRKKPIAVEAIQFTGTNGFEIQAWSNEAVLQSPILEPTEENPLGVYLLIKTLEGTMIAIVNDYIIRGVKGEYYPCKPDIFHKSYELVK